MPKFEKKYCYCVWDNELKGKRCFVADDINVLQRVVEVNDTAWLRDITGKSTCAPFPFSYIGNYYRFCYHDPYYELKLAYEQGKTIQFLVEVLGCEKWADVHEPIWNSVPERYRIKPDEPEEQTPVTNRELARWLAKGNGEFLFPEFNWAVFQCRYDADAGDEPVDGKFLVRKWEDKVWHKPTREYMGLEG